MRFAFTLGGTRFNLCGAGIGGDCVSKSLIFGNNRFDFLTMIVIVGQRCINLCHRKVVDSGDFFGRCIQMNMENCNIGYPDSMSCDTRVAPKNAWRFYNQRAIATCHRNQP